MIQNFPPSGFISAESAVEGIKVFVPAPLDEAVQQEVVAFKCPNCGADQAYSAADQSLICAACGHREVPQQVIIGKQAEEFEFKVETLQKSAQGWGVERREMQCQNCGAVTSIPPEMLTHTCPFCTSTRVIQSKALQDVLRPRYLIAPKITPQACHDLTKTWLGSSWMTPRELSGEAVLDRFVPIYLPFWTFDADTAANWRAEVGHTKTVGSGKNRRTVTVWRWESGHVDLRIDDLLVSGTARVSEIILGRVSDFSTTELVPYDPTFLAGISALAYERNLEAAWEMGRQRMREQTKSACYKQMSSSKVRNFSMQMDFNNESWRYVLLPVYVATYKFQDKIFQVLANGQTGRVDGQRPVAWPKVWAAITALFIPGVLALLIACVLGASGQLGGEDAGDVVLFILAMLFGGAGLGTFSILKTAAAMDDA